MQSSPRAILFDLDGTLADTAPDLAAAINAVRAARRLPPVAYESLRPVASAGAKGLIGAAFGMKPGDPGYDELRDEFFAGYTASLANETRLFDGIRSLLDELKRRGLVWGIVTNKSERFTLPLIGKIGLADAACVVSGDTTPHSKPHPEPLLEASRSLGLPPAQCWYVGDDLRDVQAGSAAGMVTVAAGWGYCGDSAPETWSATLIIDSPAALLDHLDTPKRR